MAETDYAQFETKTPGDRSTMNVLYGLHVVAPFTMWSLAVIALVINYTCLCIFVLIFRVFSVTGTCTCTGTSLYVTTLY